jgi:hypothetical protein
MRTKTRPPLHQRPTPLRSAALTEVIERTYEVFSRYKLAGPLDVCTACCVTLEDAEALTKTPLRELSSELLGQFTDTAQSKTPSFDQLNYFLPRYFELLADRQTPSHSLPLALQRLTPFSSDRWTMEERQCIDDFASAFFLAHLKAPTEKLWMWDTTRVLLMFWKANIDIQPLWVLWADNPTPTAVLDFTDLTVNDMDWTCEPPLFIHSLAEAHMSEPIVAWIRSDSVRNKLGPTIESYILRDFTFEDYKKDVTFEYLAEADLSSAYDIIHPVRPM